MPLLMLVNEAEAFHGRQVLLFLANTSALYSYAKGCSGNRVVETSIRLFYFIVFRLECTFWFEFVPSKQNQADGISR